MVTLYDWQKPLSDRIVEILTTGDVCLNALGTGVGKTYLAVDAAIRMNTPFLVIAPKSTLISWQRVAEQMGAKHLLKGVVNPERISLARCAWYHDETWHLDDIRLVIFDEIHKGCSGPDSKATLAAARLKKLPVKKLLMSATAADSPLKMRALGYLLGLHNFSKVEFNRWAEKHGCFWNKNLSPAVFQFTKSKKDALRHMTKIRGDIANNLIRIPISEIPGFPESMVSSKLYDLEKEDAAAVELAYREMEERMKRPGTNILVEMLRARERSEFAKASLISELVEDILEEDRSVVVFVNFRSALQRLEKAIRARGVSEVGVIHGDQTAGERQTAIDDFQANRSHVIICMIQAGGVGISLHDVHHQRPRASLITPGFNAAELVQALGRIWRAGGTHTTQEFVLCARTIEERVHSAVSAKLGNINALNDGDLTGGIS